jgi:eukaryotic-like serine/threonine-protein kinase
VVRRPEATTGPELHRDLSAMSTERLSSEHIRATQKDLDSLGDAFQTQPMKMSHLQEMKASHLASKLEFEMRPGLAVGEYIVEEKLGEGGMGEVWRARQPMIDKQVALKVLGQDIIANKSSLSRFLQEARAVNQIKHRNLVDIFSFGELPDGRPYFVMEFLDGKDLGVYLQQHGTLPFSEILHIFDQTCRALQAAHDRQIIHRDMKPDNIYLILEPNQPPFVKILDFGIAKLSGGENKRLTHTNAVIGTPGYMAPEQCEGAKNVDHRADIYALAVILFESLTGQTPFAIPGESAFATVARQMTSVAPKASSKIANRVIPPAVDLFLLKALSKDREARPRSCSEFYQQLLIAVGDKKTETRAKMSEWLMSSVETTAVSIDIESPTPLASARVAPKSNLDGLVGEVVGAEPPARDKKKVAVWLGGVLSLLVGSLLGLYLFPQEAPQATEAPRARPAIAPVSAPASSPTSATAPAVTAPESKDPKKDPKKSPVKPSEKASRKDSQTPSNPKATEFNPNDRLPP